MKAHAKYLINGLEYHSFICNDGVERIRLPQRWIDHGFNRARWETPYIAIPPHALKLRDKK
jgi:hypothetical protein